MKHFWLFSISTLLFTINGLAQEVIDIQATEKVAESTPGAARSEILDKIVEKISMQNIEALIGKEKVQRNKELIQNKIIKASNKYILSSRSGPLTKVEGGKELEMKVDMKVSLKNLRTMLLQEGLLYQMEGPPKLLPIVRVVDRVSAVSYNWWSEKPGRETVFVLSAFKSFQNSLQDQLMKIGFYSLNPIEGNYGDSVPEAYRVQAPQRGDLLFLGELFKSSIILRGDIILRGKPNSEGIYLIDFRLQALQTQNGRVLAEVIRVYETADGDYKSVVVKKFNQVAPKVAEDLASQMDDTWKKGTFGASLLRLIVRSELPPKEIEEFKKSVVIQVREIKALRERVLESGRVTYEMDSSAPAGQLAQALRTARFSQFKVQVKDSDSDSVTLDVSKL